MHEGQSFVMHLEIWNKETEVNHGKGITSRSEGHVTIYILKNQLFALKYTLKHSLIKNKLISTPTCFGPIRPSSGSCHA